MAYIGQEPVNTFSPVPSKDSFTGDGSTTTFDLQNPVVNGGENALEVFVNNVRQEPGSGKAFTLGVDGSNEIKRITFTAAPANGASIYVINDKTSNVSTVSPLDLNGVEFILDLDGDSSLTADTDDRIDFKLAGTDHIQLGTSSGDTTIKIATDAKDLQFLQADGNKILEINDGNFVGVGGNSAAPGEIRIFEDTDNGSNYVGFKAGNNTASVSYVLPTADGTAGYQLTTDGSGTLSWAAAQIALANDGNNRIVTGTGSAGLNAEANLTFDGSTLALTGAMTSSGAITGSSTVQGTTITATTAFVPDASDGAALGTTALEFSDLFLADGAVINFGDDQEVTLTHTADTGLTLNSTNKLMFNDASQFIQGASATVLDIAATDEIELTATLIDIVGNSTVSGTLGVTGIATFTDDIIIGDGKTIGSASDVDAITIAANGQLTLTQTLIGTALDISGNIDVDGTTNLDVVDIDGAVDMASTLQVDGAITSSDGMTITTADNTDTLTLVSTDADANVGPNLNLYRNSGSPADDDVTGVIVFNGRNDNSQDVIYARQLSYIKDASDGTEDGQLTLQTMVAGTIRDRLNITPAEIVLNEDSQDLDFRVESNGQANAFKIDAGTDTASFAVPVDIDSGITIDNITIDGTEIDLSSGDLTLDVAGDIILDAGGNNWSFQSGGTEVLNIANSSSDVIIKPVVDAKDIILQQRDGTEVARVEDGAYMSFAAMAVNPEATLTDASTVSWNALTSPVAKVTLAGNRTIAAASGAVAGTFASLLVIQDGTGSRTVTWNAAYEFAADTAPTLTTTASKGDLFVFRYNGSKWLEVGRNLALTLS